MERVSICLGEYMWNDDLQLSGRVLKYLCNNRKSSYGKRTDRKGESERRKVNKAKYASGPNMTERRKAK